MAGKFIFNPFIGNLDWTETVEGTAVSIIVDASLFTKNLSIADVNVQHALETIDQLSLGISQAEAIRWAMVFGG